MWVHDWPFVQGTGVQISLEPNFFFLIWIIIFKWKLLFTSLWYSKPILYYSLFKFFMSSWQYIESKHIWGLRRVSELYIVKMRPFLFITSVAPSLGPPICLKIPFFNFSSAKLPSLILMSIVDISAIQLRGTRLDVILCLMVQWSRVLKGGSEVVMVKPVKPSFLFLSRRQLE